MKPARTTHPRRASTGFGVTALLLLANGTFAAQTVAAAPAAAAPVVSVMSYTCEVSEIASFPNRVHVRCGGGQAPWYFAVPTTSSAEAARLMALGTAAFSTGRPLMLMVDFHDYQAEAYGCLVQNCRRPTSFSIGK